MICIFILYDKFQIVSTLKKTCERKRVPREEELWDFRMELMWQSEQRRIRIAVADLFRFLRHAVDALGREARGGGQYVTLTDQGYGNADHILKSASFRKSVIVAGCAVGVGLKGGLPRGEILFSTKEMSSSPNATTSYYMTGLTAYVFGDTTFSGQEKEPPQR